MLVEEETSGLVFKGWLDFYCVARPQWWDVLDEGYSHNKYNAYEVFLVLGSADLPAARLKDSLCVD